DLAHAGPAPPGGGGGVAQKEARGCDSASSPPRGRWVPRPPPYMNNGSAATLEDVVRHYEKGGIDRPSRSPLLQPIKLTDQERGDLVAFMETLGPPAATR